MRYVFQTFFAIFLFYCAPLLPQHILEHTTDIARFLRPIENIFPSGIEGIDCIYVINLAERPDKWQRVEALLKERGLQGTRIDAVNGSKLSESEKKHLTGPYKSKMKPGAFGCLLSHISVYKDAYERGFEKIWILEDDVEFLEEFQKIPTLLTRLQQFDPDWDIFYTDHDSRRLGGGYSYPTELSKRKDQYLPPTSYFLQREEVVEKITKLRLRYGTYSMIISRKGIATLYDYFTHVYLWSPIDIDLHTIPCIRQYASSKEIVSHWNESPHSDTQIPMSKLNYN